MYTHPHIQNDMLDVRVTGRKVNFWVDETILTTMDHLPLKRKHVGDRFVQIVCKTIS